MRSKPYKVVTLHADPSVWTTANPDQTMEILRPADAVALADEAVDVDSGIVEVVAVVVALEVVVVAVALVIVADVVVEVEAPTVEGLVISVEKRPPSRLAT